MIAYILNFLSYFLSLLNPRALSMLSQIIARLVFSVLRLRRSLILNNLGRAFGDSMSPSQKKYVGYLSQYYFTLAMAEFLAARKGNLGDNVDIEGEEILRDALKEGHGAYILCIHMGPWEAMGAKLSKIGIVARTIVKKVGGKSTNDFVSQQRTKNGFLVIERQKKGDGLRGIQKALANNEIVGFVIDQARPGERRLPFFGHPAKSNTSFAAIWRRFPAPIIPAFIRRMPNGRSLITVWPRIELEDKSDSNEAILKNTVQFNRVVEKMIRECPEQYFWMHDRWKE